MSWGAKFRAAVHGDVDGSDVAALLSASGAIEDLRDKLAERRLQAELAHPDEGWRTLLDVGEAAASLWLADSLSSLARSIAEAEAEAHPQAPALMSADSHRAALTLLAPVQTLVPEISAALVDSKRRSSISLPYVLLRRHVADESTLPPTGSYIRGLLRGADRLETAAQVALDDFSQACSHGATPGWVDAARQQLQGEAESARVRLGMVRSRTAALLNRESLDARTSHEAATELCEICDRYLLIGQMASSARLLPGAPPPSKAVTGSSARTPPPVPRAPARQVPPPQVPTPLAPVSMHSRPEEEARATPEISPTWEPPTEHTGGAPRLAPVVGPPANEPPRAIPRIETSPRVSADRARAIPSISANANANSPRVPAAEEVPRAVPNIDQSPRRTVDGERTIPAIGSSAPAKPAQAAGGRRVEHGERWMLSCARARHNLRISGGEEQAERDLAAFWDAKHWSLTTDEQSYLRGVDDLLARHAIVDSGRSLLQCPFSSIFQVSRPGVTILGAPIPNGSRFSYDFRAGGRKLMTGLTAEDGIPC